jgi:hypothetical protein
MKTKEILLVGAGATIIYLFWKRSTKAKDSKSLVGTIGGTLPNIQMGKPEDVTIKTLPPDKIYPLELPPNMDLPNLTKGTGVDTEIAIQQGGVLTTPTPIISDVPPTGNVPSMPEQVQEISPASLSDLQAIIYLAKYTDLNRAFRGNLQNAKEHWIRLGKSEQRTIPLIKNSVSSPAQLSDQQTMIYLAKYPDLLQAFGVNFDLAKKHWVNLGKAEGRTIDVVI